MSREVHHLRSSGPAHLAPTRQSASAEGKHPQERLGFDRCRLRDCVLRFVVLERFDSDAPLNDAERRWIEIGRAALGRRLTNTTDGGEGCRGLVHSAETRARLSKLNTGRSLTPEQRAKIAAASSRHRHSAETREKMSAWQRGRGLGRKLSAETCAKLSAARTGKPGTMRGRKHTPEARAKMSASRTGKPGTMLGRHHTPESCAKMSAQRRGRTFSLEHRKKIADAVRAYHARRRDAVGVDLHHLERLTPRRGS